MYSFVIGIGGLGILSYVKLAHFSFSSPFNIIYCLETLKLFEKLLEKYLYDPICCVCEIRLYCVKNGYVYIFNL